MSTFRLLVVEDDLEDLKNYRGTIRGYAAQRGRDIELVECRTREEVFEKLDKSFDGAIIDLTLFEEDDAGNQVIKKIVESFFRIPIAVITEDPDNWDDSLNEKIMLIDVFRKREVNHNEILDIFWDIYNTGLTHIMGGRGKIEKTLNQVFLENLKPNKKSWISYAKNGEDEEARKINSERTQNALLRYTLNHLLQLLEDDEEDRLPEEVYLYPPVLDRIRTGNMVKANDQWFVVLNPACDLVPINGEFKTDRILLVEIERDAVKDVLRKSNNNKDKKRKLDALSKNTHAFYYHWLPPVRFESSDGQILNFDGGILNFRKLKTLTKVYFQKKFGDPLIQISPSFMKDIISRFSSYYARQGQPNLDRDARKAFIASHMP